MLRTLGIVLCIFLITGASSDKLERRIIGGQEAFITECPYQVSVLSNGQHICGGVLLNPKTVLTAAHCLYGRPNAIGLQVKAGSHLRTYGGLRRRVVSFIIHENYNKRTYDYDVAIMKLNFPYRFSRLISNIKLPEENENLTENTKVTVYGWGVTQHGTLSQTLQKLTVPVVSTETCKKSYRILTDRMICAGYPEGKKDSCNGDSGGALVHGRTLCGIVSWGFECALPDYPGVYTNIHYLRKWILDKM